VRSSRISAGWSQERLADEAGLHRTYVGGVERGERNLSLDAIWQLAAALDLSPADFFAAR
jgi:transcriptional regulator with XRE-family HTH domain